MLKIDIYHHTECWEVQTHYRCQKRKRVNLIIHSHIHTYIHTYIHTHTHTFLIGSILKNNNNEKKIK